MLKEEFFKQIVNERERQIELWGTEEDQIEKHGWDQFMTYKMLVFIEEVGEVAKHILEHEPDKALVELIQVAAVCQAWAEVIND